jgi:hypothetical protein
MLSRPAEQTSLLYAGKGGDTWLPGTGKSKSISRMLIRHKSWLDAAID